MGSRGDRRWSKVDRSTKPLLVQLLIMTIPSPEEAKAIKAAKEAAKRAKKEKYGNQNIPIVEVKIPWCWADEPSNKSIAGKELRQEIVDQWIIDAERGWRVSDAIRRDAYPHDIYRGPVKLKIIRT